MKSKIAVCGLECDKCDIYLIDEDESIAGQILKWFKNEGWRPETITVQEFMQEGKLCLGCRSDREDKHWSGNCWILACCVDDKKLTSCHRCPEFLCEKLDEWSKENEGYTQAIQRLKQLKSNETT
jgi:hypothetical protein